MAISALRKLQLGQEVTAGTPVAATAIWRGTFKYNDDRTIQSVPEDIGQLLAKHRQIEVARQATLEMSETPATFEQLPYILSASIEATVSGAADGAGSGKIYEYNLGVASANVPKTYTLEVGDNQRVDEIEYAYVNKFTLKGASKEAIRVSASWLGRQCTDAEFTSITPATVEDMLFGKTIIAIDAAGGTIGATAKTSTWMGFELNVDPGIRALWTGDNQLTFKLLGYTERKITGKLIVLHDATGEAEIAIARSMATRLLKITCAGSALSSAGTTYSVKTFSFAAAIQYTGVPDLGDKEDQVTVELPFEVVDADSKIPTFIVVNELAALT